MEYDSPGDNLANAIIVCVGNQQIAKEVQSHCIRVKKTGIGGRSAVPSETAIGVHDPAGNGRDDAIGSDFANTVNRL